MIFFSSIDKQRSSISLLGIIIDGGKNLVVYEVIQKTLQNQVLSKLALSYKISEIRELAQK